MDNCNCPHDARAHAPLAEFGASICLIVDCDCNGTHAQVAAAVAERAKRNVPEALVALISEVLRNPMHVTTEEKARNLAAAILGNFEVGAL